MSNRNLSFTDSAVQWALIVTLAVSVLLLVLPRLLGLAGRQCEPWSA